jgi:hypothetical protein
MTVDTRGLYVNRSLNSVRRPCVPNPLQSMAIEPLLAVVILDNMILNLVILATPPVV